MGRRFSKSGLFLMELVIAIGFFAVASAVCAQLFADAHTTSKKGSDLSMAVVAAESAAEEFKAAANAEIVPGTDKILYYGSDWQPAASDLMLGAPYATVITYSAEERLLVADIAVYENYVEEPIYRITAKKAVNS
jgi:hypothetical protein